MRSPARDSSGRRGRRSLVDTVPVRAYHAPVDLQLTIPRPVTTEPTVVKLPAQFILRALDRIADLTEIDPALARQATLELGETLRRLVGIDPEREPPVPELEPAAFRFRFHKLPIEAAGGSRFIRVADVRYVAARGSHSVAKTYDGEHATRFSLTELATRLQPSGFMRVHRGFLVNLDHVLELHPFFGGSYLLRVDDAQRSEIPVSRPNVKSVRHALGL
ncbi:MAG: LytTR family transcriptional regulator [Chloroflexi bacterium]|nr:LytTR family transcriptional regulator [Chloroflexota bacterium]